jgi:hypothetical protein
MAEAPHWTKLYRRTEFYVENGLRVPFALGKLLRNNGIGGKDGRNSIRVGYAKPA